MLGPPSLILACLAMAATAMQPTAARTPRSTRYHRTNSIRAQAGAWPALAFRAPLGGHVLRSRKLIAQYDAQGLPAGWTTGFDQANQCTYYVNEQTGQSQWEPPQQEASQQEYGSFDAYAQQQQVPQQEYGNVAGKLDLDQYRQYTSDRGERVTETELRRRFDELNQAYNDSPDQYGQHTGGRDQFLRGGAGPSFKGGAYNFAGQQGRELSPLVEFLRWQEWYVQYCKLRNIGQGAQR